MASTAPETLDWDVDLSDVRASAETAPDDSPTGRSFVMQVGLQFWFLEGTLHGALASKLSMLKPGDEVAE